MSQKSPVRQWLAIGTAALLLLGIAWGISAITTHNPTGNGTQTLSSSSFDAGTPAGGQGNNAFGREGNEGGRESGGDDGPNERQSRGGGLNPTAPGGGSTTSSTPGPTA